MLTFQIASDTDHESVVAEINHEDKFLCLISKEVADDVVMIELPVNLPTTGPESFQRLKLDEFIKMIDRARDELLNPK